MKILDLALKDLRQMLYDKNSALFLVAMPIAFTFFMGFAYRSGETGEAEDQRIPIAWVEEEPVSMMSNMLYSHIEKAEAIEITPMENDAAQSALQGGKVAGILIIPSDFDIKVQQNQNPQLTLVADSTSTTGQSLYQLLRVPVSQLISTFEIGHMSVENLDDPEEFIPTVKLAWEKWTTNNLSSLVRVEQAVGQQAESWFGDNPYNQASPGIIVQFAIIGLVTSAQILVQERKTRTLQRLMSTSMRRWQIIAGHMLAMFVIVFLQTALMVIFGQFVLNVNYLRVPFGTLLLTVSLGLWIASMGLLIGTLAKSDNQVVLFSMLAMFVFSALGGTWFPLEAAGGTFATIGKLLPSSWAMIGLQNILIRGLNVGSLWQPVAILMAYAFGFFILAVWRFRKAEM